MTRRTYRVEEIDGMLEASKSDTRTTLLLVLLSEVGLRMAALRHLQYYDLVDEGDKPRHICSVVEKGHAKRSFVTSERLKDAIAAHLERVRCIASAGDFPLSACYVLSVEPPTEPVTPAAVSDWLRKLAKAAGVKDVQVHAHAFRHTIVGRLMDAGNSLELVSKYMGHKSLDTTSSHYWVANVQELHENLNNPMTGSYQGAVRDEELKDTELAVLRKKKSKAMDVIRRMLGVMDEVKNAGGSLEDAVDKIKEGMPNLAEILRIIGADET
jgi:site-specific recombinase XerD